jgi:dTDP-4-dehydrorhamnose reductase
MKIAVIGADGQLGSDLVKALRGDELIPLYYPGFDITEPAAARRTLREIRPDTVINTAAFNRVDEGEDEPWTAFRLNALAVRELSQAARELGFCLVHFSTDYIFDGRKGSPYVEDDAPNPLSVYGVSKLAGEYFVRALLDRFFLVRTCGLYGAAGSKEKGYNFVDRVISLAGEGKTVRVVDDQWVTPTSTAELAERLSALIRTDRYGLYHLTNEGACTWYEFAREIFSLLGREVRLEPIDSRAQGAKARRPRFSVLENRRAKEIGLPDFSPWREALRDYLKVKGWLS